MGGGESTPAPTQAPTCAQPNSCYSDADCACGYWCDKFWLYSNCEPLPSWMQTSDVLTVPTEWIQLLVVAFLLILVTVNITCLVMRRCRRTTKRRDTIKVYDSD